MNEIKAARNKVIRSKVKTAVKKVDAAITTDDKVAVQAQSISTITETDKATTKGVYHKNTASRKILRLTKTVNVMA